MTRDEPSNVDEYAASVRTALPRRAFEPVPQRLVWLALHWCVGVGCVVVVLHASLPWRALSSVVLGHSLGCCVLLGHEILHGSVVRSRRLCRWLGTLCFLPFGLLAAAWVRWHNQAHHKHTQFPTYDPDFAGTLAMYRSSPSLRLAHAIMPGSGNWLSAAFLFVNFSFHSSRVVHAWPAQPSQRREARSARLYHVAALLAWPMAVAGLVGPWALGWLWLVPLACCNALVMSYIATNHFLMPYTATNDPLKNTLSVSVPSFIQWLHLQFNLHVEHHIFPYLSPKFAPLVRAELLRRWPHRYQSLPLHVALWRLYTTPRVYAGATTLVHPKSGARAATLSAGRSATPEHDRAAVHEPAAEAVQDH